MPIVSDDLDGDALYAVAFAGTLATSVIGMVAVGAWSDRSGPKAPLYAAVALFVIGLVIAGLAPTMPILVVGRLIQGLGTGGQTVALYVVVARVYPPADPRPRVRGLLGGMGRAVADRPLPRRRRDGVPALEVGVPRCRGAHASSRSRWSRCDCTATPLHTDEPPDGKVGPRLACAVAVAIGALALSLAGELGSWSVLRGRGIRSRHRLRRPAAAAAAHPAGRTRPAERRAHARPHRRRAVRRRDLRAVPADRRVRLLADVGGPGADGGRARVGRRRRRAGARRRPHRQRAHHPDRHRAAVHVPRRRGRRRVGPSVTRLS